MATTRTKRDRIPFTCPNCPTRVYSKPSNRLICGQCHIRLKPQVPADYPEALDPAKPNIPTVPPAEIPLEQLALPAHIRHLLDSITEPAPEPEDASVVRQPEPEKTPPAMQGCHLRNSPWPTGQSRPALGVTPRADRSAAGGGRNWLR